MPLAAGRGIEPVGQRGEFFFASHEWGAPGAAACGCCVASDLREERVRPGRSIGDDVDPLYDVGVAMATGCAGRSQKGDLWRSQFGDDQVRDSAGSQGMDDLVVVKEAGERERLVGDYLAGVPICRSS